MINTQKSYWLAISSLFLTLGLLSCVSKLTQDLSGGTKESTRWELITVQPDYIDNSSFLGVSHLDGEKLAKPLIFGLDVILLSPGEHTLSLVLGGFETYEELSEIDESYDDWWAELGELQLKEPLYDKGRNYLVASYDKIYSSSTKSPEYMQYWVVNYPRTIDADKNWSIEPLDPELQDALDEDQADQSDQSDQAEAN